MAKVKFYLDPVANTLNIWWGKKTDAKKAIEVRNPNRDDVIVIDKKGRPVSLEIIGFFPEELDVVKYLDSNQIKSFLNTGKIDLHKLQLKEKN